MIERTYIKLILIALPIYAIVAFITFVMNAEDTNNYSNNLVIELQNEKDRLSILSQQQAITIINLKDKNESLIKQFIIFEEETSRNCNLY